MVNGHKKFLALSHVVLIIVTILCVLPFYLLIVASFTDESFAVNNGFSLIPSHLSVDAYRYLLTKAALFGRGYLITLIVTVCGTLACIVITLAFSYMLSRPGLPFRRAFNFYVVFTMLFNGGLVSTYIMYTTVFHVKNTLFALILPNLDGCSEVGIFAKVAFPLSKPIIATVGLMVGVAYWNDWQNGLYYIDDQKLYGIQNILNAINENAKYLMTGGGSAAMQMPANTSRMAAAVIGIIPILIVYPFFQDYFVKGITMGAVKG